MDLIKKIWPFSFKVKNGVVSSLVWMVILYFAAGTVSSILFSLISDIPFVGWSFSMLGGLADVYCTAGIVFCFLAYFKVGPFGN